jgi:hypothetical protein
MSAEEPPEGPLANVIDSVLSAFSWAFLPLIIASGLILSNASGDVFPIRVGARPDPLEFAAPQRAPPRAALPPNSMSDSPSLTLLAVAAPARADPLLDDLLDSSAAARALSLPESEQRRARALQDLEDERLERCRTSPSESFDQCFFFGGRGTIDARRPMEGAGRLMATQQPERETLQRASQGIPTW